MESNKYPIEVLKCIAFLIRNLITKEALVNGTRLRIQFMHLNGIDCKDLTVTARNKKILIHCINLTFSGTISGIKEGVVRPLVLNKTLSTSTSVMYDLRYKKRSPYKTMSLLQKFLRIIVIFF